MIYEFMFKLNLKLVVILSKVVKYFIDNKYPSDLKEIILKSTGALKH